MVARQPVPAIQNLARTVMLKNKLASKMKCSSRRPFRHPRSTRLQITSHEAAASQKSDSSLKDLIAVDRKAVAIAATAAISIASITRTIKKST